MSKVLVINGHPGTQSLSRQIAESYAQAAEKAGHSVRTAHLSEMTFDMDHGEGGYRHSKPLEPELERFLEHLAWAQHIVLSTPMWWGGLPGKLKGLLDRTLLPGRAFDPRTVIRGAPKPLLTGRTARAFLTSDTPSWAMAALYGNALFKQLRRQIFGFVGIKPTRITHFNLASHPEEPQVRRWLQRAAELGSDAR